MLQTTLVLPRIAQEESYRNSFGVYPEAIHPVVTGTGTVQKANFSVLVFSSAKASLGK